MSVLTSEEKAIIKQRLAIFNVYICEILKVRDDIKALIRLDDIFDLTDVTNRIGISRNNILRIISQIGVLGHMGLPSKANTPLFINGE